MESMRIGRRTVQRRHEVDVPYVWSDTADRGIVDAAEILRIADKVYLLEEYVVDSFVSREALADQTQSPQLMNKVSLKCISMISPDMVV